jgi:glycine cleavage system H protein
METNEAIIDAPEIVNQDPYGDGWLFKIKPNDAGETEDLLTPDSYQELTQEESH